MLATEGLWSLAGWAAYEAWHATHKRHFLSSVSYSALFSFGGLVCLIILAALLVGADDEG